MSKNPYEVLGLKEGASREEVDQAYYALRDQYRQELYQDGALGKSAAQKLGDVETAYHTILAGGFVSPTNEEISTNEESSTNQEASTNEGIGADFAEVDRLLKAGDYKGAQQALDGVNMRNAEWHYFQSVIYYKKGWLNESRNQLDLAVNMDPDNEHYRTVLAKLDAKISGGTQGQGQFNATPNANYQQNNGSYRSYQENDARYAEDSACRCCETMLCLNCLCNCCLR